MSPAYPVLSLIERCWGSAALALRVAIVQAGVLCTAPPSTRFYHATCKVPPTTCPKGLIEDVVRQIPQVRVAVCLTALISRPRSSAKRPILIRESKRSSKLSTHAMYSKVRVLSTFLVAVGGSWEASRTTIRCSKSDVLLLGFEVWLFTKQQIHSN
jgi:hypothetical protein